PLPYKHPEQLVSLWETNTKKNLDHELMSPVNFVDYSALHGVFSAAAGWWRTQMVLDDNSGSEPTRVRSIEATSNFFTTLGVTPAIGHTFDGDSLLRVPTHQVIISDRLWRSNFGGSAAAIGKQIRLNGDSYTIVGVMPADFNFPANIDVWAGLSWTMSQHSRTAHFWEGLARLAPGVTEARANNELSALTGRLAASFAATNLGWSARVIPLDRELSGTFRPALFALLGASLLLLVIACINVANLLLARGATRRREVALRSAIGADRMRIVRLLLTESIILSIVGTLLGLVIAVVGVRALLAWSPIDIPRSSDIGVNGGVLLFCALATVLTAVSFGLVPALSLSKADPIDALREGSRGAGVRSRRTRSFLVVAEVALAVMLLSGASLVVRSVSGLLNENIGVDARGSISGDVQLSGANYENYSKVITFYDQLLTALRARPEITSAGAGYYLPLEVAYRLAYTIPGVPPAAGEESPKAQFHSVDEGYFATLHATMLKGRTFARTDDDKSVPVVVVNESFAKRQFPAGDAVGKSISTTVTNIGPLGARITKDPLHEIVGIVADIRNTSLREATEPAIYFTTRQFPYRTLHVVMRGHGDVAQLGSVLRDEVRRLDRTLAVGDLKPMEQVLASSIDPPRLMRMLLGVFAVLALTLAAVGIYGILTFSVANRRREMSVRIALGANPGSVLWLVVREGLVLAAAGFVLGVVGTLLAGKSLNSFLYGVTAWDAATMGSVLVVVLAVAGTACFAPGLRASREDPARALRAE
ncbi:MAG: ABC transporter permease, partial [Gemmatimonadaceae bacterium]